MTLALSLFDAGIGETSRFTNRSPQLGNWAWASTSCLTPYANLSELGFSLQELQNAGIPTAGLAYYSKHGQRIWSEPRGLAAGYNWPQFSVHRGELLAILHRAVIQRLGSSRLHTGHHLVRFGEAAGRVWAELLPTKKPEGA